ncbi:hypothetical protein [Acidovorax sp.]|uniref:hypothetical protein n=1 Tax=Acidovorax sp. TaxID=1872122 RepID=UPI0025C216F7|nr:hypothetical protein [Acidovorax sp.]
MFILVAPVIFAVAVTGIVYVNSPGQGEAVKWSARAELTRYRIFVSTADTFFKSVPAPSIPSSYRWDDIKSAAPSGYSGSTFRNDWRAVRASDGTWAACTPMNEVTVAMLNQVYREASTPPPGGSAATSGLIGNRILPSSLAGGSAGSLQLNSPNVSGLVALGTQTEAISASNLCNQ